MHERFSNDSVQTARFDGRGTTECRARANLVYRVVGDENGEGACARIGAEL